MINKFKTDLITFLEEFEAVKADCGREKDQIDICFATKYLNEEGLAIFIQAALDIGFKEIIIGENRVVDAERKFKFLSDFEPELFSKIKKVMIGTLQKNKINRSLRIFSQIQSVESLELAKALNERLEKAGKEMEVFLEVNASGELSKHGIKPSDADNVVSSIKMLKLLKLEGFMAMMPLINPQEVRPYFSKLKELANIYGFKTSMGMSNDWKVAISEGSDMIRIGSRIFRE